MRYFLITALTLIVLAACKPGKSPDAENAASNIHKIMVQEVIQVPQYTYLRVLEDGKERWLAVRTMDARVGGTYYYEGGTVMNNFQSKELNRTFDEILFLETVSTEPTAATPQAGQAAPTGDQGAEATPPASGNQPQKPIIEKSNIRVDPAKGGITIAELYASRAKYDGKAVKIRGQVTRYNEGIMNRNWVHIQDGTDDKGNFDLTITTQSPVQVGETVTFKGKIALKKDFGYGYYYEVIMEDAEKLK